MRTELLYTDYGDTMNSDRLANRIYELRKSKGLSQKELGALVGVSNKAVSKWETGAAIPKTDILLKLADVFEISVQEFLEQSAEKIDKPRTLFDVAQDTEELLYCENNRTVRVTELFLRDRAKWYLLGVAIAWVLSLGLMYIAHRNLSGISQVLLSDLWVTVDILLAITLPSLFTGLWYAVCVIRKLPFWMQILCLVVWLYALCFCLLAGVLLLLPSIGIAIVQCFKQKGGKRNEQCKNNNSTV